MTSQQALLCEPHHAVSDTALDRLFRDAHTGSKWLDKEVSTALLMAVYDLTRFGPTASDITPLRIVFVVSVQAKARLKPHLSQDTIQQSIEAPVIAILGYDLDFLRHRPFLYRDDPKTQSKACDPQANTIVALRNASLQGGYFILAARSLGLDCGPMDGFDHAAIDAQFFAGTAIKSNLLCNLGYAAQEETPSRNPKPSFDEACQIL
jgi:3-hydroxypropanoate dehydrogenase